MDEKFVALDTFKSLTEKGFCYYHFPTQSFAQKWLREAKDIDVLVWNRACGYGWEISKAGDKQTRGTTLLMFDEEGEDEDSGMWLSYEAALQDGIKKALKLIN
jgi:hypothetical protein